MQCILGRQCLADDDKHDLSRGFDRRGVFAWCSRTSQASATWNKKHAKICHEAYSLAHWILAFYFNVSLFGEIVETRFNSLNGDIYCWIRLQMKHQLYMRLARPISNALY